MAQGEKDQKQYRSVCCIRVAHCRNALSEERIQQPRLFSGIAWASHLTTLGCFSTCSVFASRSAEFPLLASSQKHCFMTRKALSAFLRTREVVPCPPFASWLSTWIRAGVRSAGEADTAAQEQHGAVPRSLRYRPPSRSFSFRAAFWCSGPGRAGGGEPAHRPPEKPDFSQVDKLGCWYKFVNFVAGSNRL